MAANQKTDARKLPERHGLDGLVDMVAAIKAGMRIALPRIDGEAAGRQIPILDRLAKAEEGGAVKRAELRDQARLGKAHKIVSETAMARLCAVRHIG